MQTLHPTNLTDIYKISIIFSLILSYSLWFAISCGS